MNSMIQDLVDSACLEAHQMEMHEEPTDLSQLVADIAGRIGSQADRGRIRLEQAEPVPVVLADPTGVERVIVNLVTNALKYSTPGTPITVAVGPNGGGVLLSVKDEGAGIPAEQLPHLFEKYVRAPATKSTSGGLGLGLYIYSSPGVGCWVLGIWG